MIGERLAARSSNAIVRRSHMALGGASIIVTITPQSITLLVVTLAPLSAPTNLRILR